MVEGQARYQASRGGTLVAIVIAPVVTLVVSAVANAFLLISHLVFTVLRLEWIALGAAFPATFFGVVAARSACDHVLRSYYPRVIAVELALLALCGLVATSLLHPFGWRFAVQAVGMIAMAAGAFSAFWKGDVW